MSKFLAIIQRHVLQMKSSHSFRTVFDLAVVSQLIQAPYEEINLSSELQAM